MTHFFDLVDRDARQSIIQFDTDASSPNVRGRVSVYCFGGKVNRLAISISAESGSSVGVYGTRDQMRALMLAIGEALAKEGEGRET